MAYFRRMRILQCVLVTALLLAVAITLSLSVIYWYEEDRLDSLLECQLDSLAAFHESVATSQQQYPVRELRKASLHGASVVDIWRAEKTENRLHDWRRIYGISQERPKAAWPIDPHNTQFLDGQHADKRWRAVQRIASNSVIGDILIRVSRSRESLPTYLISRLSEVIVIWPVVAVLAVGFFVWAASRTLAPLDKLADGLKQAFTVYPASRIPVPTHCTDSELSVDNINAVLSEIISHNQRMASFASETAHELKTPLTSMMMIGEIALREPNNTADLRDSLGTILEECQHMDQLIEGILLIAQAKSKRLAVAITHVDLNALAAECVERLKPIAEASDQSLELRVPPRQIKQPALTVACDRALLRQAAINLISNAIVHNASGTQISITAESTDKGPRLIVCDNGVGFNPHAEKQIFKLESAAYRSEKKDDMRRHLGLGLSIATSLVESQGAQLTIDSKIGGGTRIAIEFSNHPIWLDSSTTDSNQTIKRPIDKTVSIVA